ncbi:MAG: hypothetical protein HC836_48585 [Richelia sp. RM2_1_2]|nr:hypothetical protein [Richelia sp. SM1_7_0]NJO27365.1 hypothetical protein [Richelia sp. SL_2_1]NJO65662.1 hypothetical protein [Richelia sp. RM2_1_2]
MSTVETLGEILVRTCERFNKIKHLPQSQRKYLMALHEDEFKLQHQKISIKKAG